MHPFPGSRDLDWRPGPSLLVLPRGVPLPSVASTKAWTLPQSRGAQVLLPSFVERGHRSGGDSVAVGIGLLRGRREGQGWQPGRGRSLRMHARQRPRRSPSSAAARGIPFVLPAWPGGARSAPAGSGLSWLVALISACFWQLIAGFTYAVRKPPIVVFSNRHSRALARRTWCSSGL